MIFRRCRQGYDDGWQTGDADLCECADAATTDDDVGGGIGHRDLVEILASAIPRIEFGKVESLHLAGRVGDGVVAVAANAARRVQDEQLIAPRLQMRQGIDDGLVDDARSLGSTDGENNEAVSRDIESGAGGGAVEIEQFAAHGKAHDGNALHVEPARRLLKDDANAICQASGDLIQQSGLGVRGVHKEPRPGQADLAQCATGEHDGSTDETTGAEDDMRAEAQQQDGGGEDAQAQVEDKPCQCQR